MGPIGCPQISVRNFPYLLHNNSEERSSTKTVVVDSAQLGSVYVLCRRTDVIGWRLAPASPGRCVRKIALGTVRLGAFRGGAYVSVSVCNVRLLK